MNWIEVIGVLASILVLVSFLMKNIIVIRLVNTFGSIVFIVYGILIGAFAIWFVNAALIVVHVIYIIGDVRVKNKKVQVLSEDKKEE